MWPEEIKRYLSIDHKIKAVPVGPIQVDPWKTVERKHVLSVYKHFEYHKTAAQTALGISGSGLSFKLKKLGVLKHTLTHATPIQLFKSAMNFKSIHEWFDADPDEVQAAYKAGITDEIKRELGW